MLRLTPFKYLSVLSLPLLVVVALSGRGWLTWAPLAYIFVLIPLLELVLKPDRRNHHQDDEKKLLDNKLFDWLLYTAVPIQWGMLAYFLYCISAPGWYAWEVAGKIASMGLMCGVFGINVAHELGHRSSAGEQLLAKALLLSTLYLHFFIEHNRGHHKRVATAEDPASARYGEMVYSFWWRSVINSYRSAWELENRRLQKINKPTFSFDNEMLRFQLVQLFLLLLIGVTGGVGVLLAFMAAAAAGILLLETVNYIEHYGLSRKTGAQGYERVQPWHSWNSSHVIGRTLLFELSRHSDHHFKSTRKYQVLRHFEESPQMPTGYPGMMLLALVPPLWFYIMHNRLQQGLMLPEQQAPA